MARAINGDRLNLEEAWELYQHADFHMLGYLAHQVRLRKHPEPQVTYVVDRNINYTNICVCGCRFCAFFRAPGQPGGYLLTRDVLAKKIEETLALGGTQILLQGGHHPDLPLSFYEDMLQFIKARFPIHVHAFSPPEIIHFRNLENTDIGLVISRLRAAALDSLNGTSNYILSKMTNEGGDFNHSLEEAQRHGYAERDPTLDIEGIDTAHKLAILISIAYGTAIPFEKIYTEGISRIEPLDIEFTRELGYGIKLLAIAREIHGKIEARVHPTLIPYNHLLSKVDGTYNAVFVDGDASGPCMFYGRGAGMMPAASAVVSDIVDLSRNLLRGVKQRVPLFSYQREFLKKLTIKNIREVVTRYYLRFSVLDRPGVLSKISGILGRHDISIHSVIQKGRRTKGGVSIFLLTHRAREASVRKALDAINRLSVVRGKTRIIRIEDEL